MLDSGCLIEQARIQNPVSRINMETKQIEELIQAVIDQDNSPHRYAVYNSKQQEELRLLSVAQ